METFRAELARKTVAFGRLLLSVEKGSAAEATALRAGVAGLQRDRAEEAHAAKERHAREVRRASQRAAA